MLLVTAASYRPNALPCSQCVRYMPGVNKLLYPRVSHEHVERARGTLNSHKAVQLLYIARDVRTHVFFSVATLARHGRCIVAPSSSRMEGIIATTPARYLSMPATIISDTRTQRAERFLKSLGVLWAGTRVVDGAKELLLL